MTKCEEFSNVMGTRPVKCFIPASFRSLCRPLMEQVEERWMDLIFRNLPQAHQFKLQFTATSGKSEWACESKGAGCFYMVHQSEHLVLKSGRFLPI